MSTELEILKTIASRLHSAGIEYMVTGSMTLALYAIPRMTRDIDIVIQVQVTDLGILVALFKNDFYIDEESVREAIADRGIFNIIHNDSIIKIDFILRKDEEYRIVEFSRRKTCDIEGVPISFVSPEDLILSKLIWMKHSLSEVQFRDVRQIVLSMRTLDHEYLTMWAQKLGIADLLKRADKNE